MGAAWAPHSLTICISSLTLHWCSALSPPASLPAYSAFCTSFFLAFSSFFFPFLFSHFLLIYLYSLPATFSHCPSPTHPPAGVSVPNAQDVHRASPLATWSGERGAKCFT